MFRKGFKLILTIVLSTVLILGSSLNMPISMTAQAETNFATGADVSWLPQMEASGYKFYDDNGNLQPDCLQILKDHGINSIRLRAFVNPSSDPVNGHCSTAETIAMAARAKALGFRVMIDLHYSDSWADPSKQVKPAAWANDDFTALKADVYNYTLGVMNALKDADALPEWVQIGNEINPGMLLPDGSISDFSKLTALINKGYDAVKAVNPNTKVVIHLANGYDNSAFRYYFDALTANNANYDVIGMSYYPYWAGVDYTSNIDALGDNLNDMAARYNKEVMVVEAGGLDTEPINTYNMLVAVQEKVKAVPNNKGIGVFYWEPEGARSWSGYPLSAWGADGRPTMALAAFKPGAVTKTDFNNAVITVPPVDEKALAVAQENVQKAEIEKIAADKALKKAVEDKAKANKAVNEAKVIINKVSKRALKTAAKALLDAAQAALNKANADEVLAYAAVDRALADLALAKANINEIKASTPIAKSLAQKAVLQASIEAATANRVLLVKKDTANKAASIVKQMAAQVAAAKKALVNIKNE